jgi:hypothetical protein
MIILVLYFYLNLFIVRHRSCAPIVRNVSMFLSIDVYLSVFHAFIVHASFYLCLSLYLSCIHCACISVAV